MLETKRTSGRRFFYATRLQAVIAVLLVAQLSLGMAASTAIGIAVTRGGFALDAASVTGSGTLFEGSLVETQKASSELKLAGGTRMLLDTATRAKVYRDRLELERGTGQIERGGSYRIVARTLAVETAGTAKVTITGANKILVAALHGPAQVRTAKGILVANLMAGKALEMTPGPDGAAAPSKLKGTLVKRGGHYYLTDQTVGITVELTKHSSLEKEVGKCVEVSGVLDPSAAPASGATQVIRVLQLASSCDSGTGAAVAAGAGAGAGAGAAAAGAGGAAAGAAGAGAGAAAAGAAAAGAAAAAVSTTAIVVGVVAAGVATGVAVGVTRDDEAPISN
jgi:hypothetical protein